MQKRAVCCFMAAGLLAATASAESIKNARTSATYATLTGAVAAAASGDTLLLTTGRFSEVVFIGAKNLTLQGRYNSTFSVQLPGGTTLVAPVTGMGSVFAVSNASVTLDSLDVSGGFPASKGARLDGAGVHLQAGSVVTAAACRVYGNEADGAGGGFYATNSTLVLDATQVFSNRAAHTNGLGDGGGIAAYRSALQIGAGSEIRQNVAFRSGGGMFLKDATAVLDGSTIAFNVASNDGGGLATAGFSNLVASSTWIADNAAGYGGGAALFGGLVDGTATFYNVTAENNLARNGGGAFYVDSDACLRLRGGVLIGNDGDSDDSDSGDGGALYVSGQASAELEPEGADLLLLENTAWNGGAIGIDDEGSVSLVCTQEFALTISANVARQNGGGIALPNNYGVLTGRGGVRIEGNSASEAGGGIAQNGGLVRLAGLPDNPFVVASNSTAYFHGGGFYADQGALLQLVDVQIGSANAGNVARNAAHSGGGVALVGQSVLQATNLVFTDNRCNYSGGGMFVSNATASLLGIPGDPAVDFDPPNLFSGNQATNASLGRGGAVCVVNGILTLHDALVTGNRARNGGGLYCSSASTSRVINCVLATNVVTLAGGGGGAYAASTANAQFLHCTIAYNGEGGLDAGAAAPVFLTNCIVVANAVTNLPPGLGATHCLVEPAYPGVNNFTGDPLFMKPSALDFRLTYGSVATNRGIALARVTRDAIGNARPTSTAHDPGAFEYDWTIMDSDSDTMPDDWEVERLLNPRDANALDDDDDDTWVNRDEYVADTDPLGSNDFFRLSGVEVVDGLAYVHAFTSSRRQYSLESLDDLTGVWSSIPGNLAFFGIGGDHPILDPRPLDARHHYRLRVWVP